MHHINETNYIITPTIVDRAFDKNPTQSKRYITNTDSIIVNTEKLKVLPLISRTR